MHWGHAVTDDFVTWELLPVALAPDQPYEDGCFSGSALQVGKDHVLFYTSHITHPEIGRKTISQTQSIAVGDGIDYAKHLDNPLISAEHLPEGASKADFRDPKVWHEKDGSLRMVVASRAADGSGQILLYESSNMVEWHYLGIVDQSRNQLGRMWECPDFFPLNGHQILLISPQEMEADPSGEFHGSNGTACLAGTWDEQDKTFHRHSVQAIDYGWDFYAPQTCLLHDGRRLMIAWMQAWDNYLALENQDWVGMMTFPRELRFQSGRLLQLPVREIEKYYTSSFAREGIMGLAPELLAAGRQLDFTLVVHNAAGAAFNLDLAANENFHTRIAYDAPHGKLTLDRSRAGMSNDIYPISQMPLHEPGETVEIRVLMDKYSVEIFLNKGQQVLTSLLLTPQEAQEVRISSIQSLKYNLQGHSVGAVGN